MITKLEPGKRYRWIVEGIADEHGNLVTADLVHDSECIDLNSCELLPDPLPTTPGSVVQVDRTGVVLLLLESGLWVSKTGFPELDPIQVAMMKTETIIDAGSR